MIPQSAKKSLPARDVSCVSGEPSASMRYGDGVWVLVSDATTWSQPAP